MDFILFEKKKVTNDICIIFKTNFYISAKVGGRIYLKIT